MMRCLWKWRFGALLLGAFFILPGCERILLHRGFPKHEGEIQGLPLSGPVEVLRDSWGIPHIYATDDHDLMVAQGFVHAQDRLWQMEIYRRLSQGRLAEVAGKEALDMDHWVRILGLPEMRQNLVETLSPEELRLAQAYVDGVNAFLSQRGEDLPLEFHSLSLRPEPWTVEDLFSSLVVNAWFLGTNYRHELVAISAGDRVGLQEWGDLFPSHPGANLPKDEYFEEIRHLKIAPLLPAAKAFHRASTGFRRGAGSNNWVVARSEDGAPLLANDPHLVLQVPGIWYFCHLQAPTLSAAGASIAGTPGIVIGHNERVAWGFTNVMTDCVDLFVIRVDPNDPTKYRVGDRALEMEREEVVLRLSDGKGVERQIFRTIHGPVITRVKKGVEAVVALKWYGTLPKGTLVDRSFRASLGLSRARDVNQALEAGAHFRYTGQNLLVADGQGHIGWHITGAVPIRRGYSGRLPGDGSSGEMDWEGFLPYAALPSRVNPSDGWIATANQRVVDDQTPHPISFAWCAPYRYERIAQLLKGLDAPSADDFRRIQMDVHSMQADRILPKILSLQYSDGKALAAVRILREWDREVRRDSVGATLYEVFLTQWVRTLLEDELEEALFLYFHTFPAMYLVQDVILDRPESPLWDRIDTPEREGPRDILEMALARAMEWLEEGLGRDAGDWTWGRLHGIDFSHPGAKRGIAGWLLRRGPYPADGDNTTVNVAGFVPAEGGYGVLLLPSLRMIVPLGDLDRTEIIGPLGQSGQPGHPHYDDMIEPWMAGERAISPFNRETVGRAAVARLILKP